MTYDLMVRECSVCERRVLIVMALDPAADGSGWRTRRVYKSSCECGMWLNDRGDRRVECPDGAAFVFEEEAA